MESAVGGSRLLAALVIGAGIALSGCASSYEAQQAALPHAYLKQARQAAQAHDAPKALAALDAAEKAWMGNNTNYGSPEITFDPEAEREIARARQSVQMQLWNDAIYYIDTAMTHPSTILPP